MSIKMQNGFLTFLLFLTGLIIGCFFYLLFIVHSHFGLDAQISVKRATLFWLIHEPSSITKISHISFDLAILLLIIFAGILYLKQVSHRNTPDELFFFALFLASLNGEILRFLQVFLVFNDRPYFEGIILTRITWAFRFLGLCSFFWASLYAQDFSYRKRGILTSLSIIFSLYLASIIPIQTSGLQVDLLYSLGDELSVTLLFALFFLIIMLNFIFSLCIKRDIKSTLALLGAFFSFLGWQSEFFSYSLGIFFLIPGIICSGLEKSKSSF